MSYRSTRWLNYLSAICLTVALLLGGMACAADAPATPPAPAAPVAAPPAAAALPFAWPPPMPTANPNESLQQNFVDMMNYLAAQAGQHPALLLLAHHFRSLALVVSTEGATMETVKWTDSAKQDHIITGAATLQALSDSFTKDWDHGSASWQTYLDGTPMIFAWASPYNGAVSLEAVVLPKDYDPNVHYPLYMELHAISPADTPLQVLLFANNVSHGPANGMFSHGTIRRAGIFVYPWAHGLTEYTGPGLLDLWDCLNEVDAYFTTDPARQYLWGFSMGGGGAWNFGARSMKQRGWAAIAIFSGTVKPHPFEADQLKHTPMWLICGEKDPWRPDVVAMDAALLKAGNTPEYFEVVKGQAHEYRGDEQDKLLDFLASHTNAHPTLPPSRLAVVHVWGDDTVDALYVNGRSVELNSGAGLARLVDGANVVACHVINRVWGGGMSFTMTLPDGKTLVSDGTWKCNTQSADGWYTCAFNDAKWPLAQVICPIEKHIGYDPAKPNFLTLFHDAGAQVLGPASPQYYRQTFQSAGGHAGFIMRGCGFTYLVFLNGVQIGQGDFSLNQTKVNGKTLNYGSQTFDCVTIKGSNVLALQITSIQPEGNGCLAKFGLFYPDTDGLLDRIGSDVGWRFSSSAAKKWTALNFDDSGWQPVTAPAFINTAYDGGGDGTGDGTFSAYFISPGDMYFRKAFTVQKAK